MNTLIAIRIEQTYHEMANHPMVCALRIVKYCAYVLSVYQLIFLRAFIREHPSLIADPSYVVFTTISPFFAILCTALLCAHLSIKITDPLSIQPFWRFYPMRVWYVKNILFSLMSVNVVFIFCMLVVSLYAMGMIYFVLFFVVFTHSSNNMVYRTLYFIVISLLYLLNYPELVNVSVVIACASVVYWWDIKNIHANNYRSRSLGTKYQNTSMVLKKERAFITYYTSELFYLLLGTIVSLVLIVLVFQFDGTENMQILTLLYMVIPIFPISLIVFNSFGMDYNAIKKLFYYTDQTLSYIGKKNRIYTFIAHCINLLIAFSFYISQHDLLLSLRYFIASIIFIDVIFTVGIFHSVLFCEPKEISFKYGQYFVSKNINIQQLLIIAIVILFFVIDQMAGLPGLMIFYFIFYYYKKYFYESHIVWCMNYQRKERNGHEK